VEDDNVQVTWPAGAPSIVRRRLVTLGTVYLALCNRRPIGCKVLGSTTVSVSGVGPAAGQEGKGST
jgi:hypothetical protein